MPPSALPSTLVLYASIEGHTERIAQRIAGELRSRGHRVDVASAMGKPDFSAYAGVIVGASVHYGRHPAWLAGFLRQNVGALRARKGAAFFSVSLGAKASYVEFPEAGGMAAATHRGVSGSAPVQQVRPD